MSYEHPVKVSDALVAFPATLGTLIPPEDQIPENYEGKRFAEALFSRWFYKGLPEYPTVKPGIDWNTARRHLHCVMGSFEPKHQHKEAAAAWLMSLWFTPESIERLSKG